MNAEDTQPKYRGIPECAKPLTHRQMLSQMSYRRGPQPAGVARQIRVAEEARKRQAADSKNYVQQVPDGGE